MRCSSTVVCLTISMLVVGLSGCHSTGSMASRSWTSSSFNPSTWRTGLKETPSSLAAAPPAIPAKPSTTAAPSYPNTSAISSVASRTSPPNISYPTTPASYSAPGSTSKNPLMPPQSGRYGRSPAMTNPIAANPANGYANPVYQNSGASATLAQNPFRATAPTVPSSNGSLANPSAVATASPYGSKIPATYPSGLPNRQSTAAGQNPRVQNPSVNSRYQAAIASSSAKASTPSYSSDPNSRHYSGSPSTGTAAAPPFGSATMPKVVGGYPSTSPGSGVISTAKAPSDNYPNIKAPVYPKTPSYPQAPLQPNGSTASKSFTPSPVNANMPVTSSATTTPPSAGYQPGTNGYQPGANQYVPGQNKYTPAQNGYQLPAVRSTAPIQSGGQVPTMYPMVPPVTGSSNSSGGPAPVFRPGSTGSVPAYPPATGSTAPPSPYSNSKSGLPVKTSARTSSVVPVGFNQTAPTWR